MTLYEAGFVQFPPRVIEESLRWEVVVRRLIDLGIGRWVVIKDRRIGEESRSFSLERENSPPVVYHGGEGLVLSGQLVLLLYPNSEGK